MSPPTISKNSLSVPDGLNPAANATGPAHTSPRSIHHSARAPASSAAIPARCSSLGRSKTQSALAPTPMPLPPSACFFSPCHATDLCLRAASRTGHRADTRPRHRCRLRARTPSRRHSSDTSSARLPSPPVKGAHVQSDLIPRPEFRFYAWAEPHHQHLGRHRNPTTFASSAADGRTTWCAYTSARPRLVWYGPRPSQQLHAQSRCVRQPMCETWRENRASLRCRISSVPRRAATHDFQVPSRPVHSETPEHPYAAAPLRWRARDRKAAPCVPYRLSFSWPVSSTRRLQFHPTERPSPPWCERP